MRTASTPCCLPGSYLYVEASNRIGKASTLLTSFSSVPLDQPLCAEFYLSMVGSEAHMGTVSVGRREADGSYDYTAQYQGRTPAEWKRTFLVLGSGLYQVAFTATTGRGPAGDMAIDDVLIAPCEVFSMYSVILTFGLVHAEWHRCRYVLNRLFPFPSCREI